MKNVYKIAMCLLLIGLPLAAQTPERIKLQGEADNLSTALMRLHRQQQILSLQADSLAKDIQRRKQQTPSLLQERGLDAMLRFSQTLADSMQALQSREQKFDAMLRQKADVLLKILNEDIARVAKQSDELKQRKQMREREAVMRELKQCHEWRQRCQSWLEQAPPAIIIYQVEAQPDEAPETLRRKADFLRDQSDRMRREVKRLEKKVAEIRDETQVRRRMEDLATDLALLDPNREGRPALAREEAQTAGIAATERDNQELATGYEAPATRLPFYQNWPAPVGEMSFEELERWHGRLEQQKKQRQAQADSLLKRAAAIEKLIPKPAEEKR
jgi:hypothetical protein